MFIRREIRHFPDPVLRDIHVRCRVQHHRDARFKAAFNDIADRVHRDLMLQHDEIRGRDHIPVLIDHLAADLVIRPLDDDDTVIPFRKCDVCRACRDAGERLHIVRLHAALFQRLFHECPVSIIPHTADHVYASPEARRRDSLISALTSGRNNQAAAHHGLARLRPSVRLHGNVHITAAYYRNMTHKPPSSFTFTNTPKKQDSPMIPSEIFDPIKKYLHNAFFFLHNRIILA